MKHIKLFENYNENDDVVYFYVEDGDNKAIIKLGKESGKWREQLVRGDELYGLGSKTYQSYLSANDLEEWLTKDYDYVEMIENEDDMDNYISECYLNEDKLADEKTAAEKKISSTGDIKKDFSIDGKYIFDDKLGDDEQEKLLMAKLDQIIKKKNIDNKKAGEVRTKWRNSIKKQGIKKFGSEIETRYKTHKGSPVTDRVSALGKKMKGEVMKGYRQPLFKVFDDVYDVLAGNIY